MKSQQRKNGNQMLHVFYTNENGNLRLEDCFVCQKAITSTRDACYGWKRVAWAEGTNVRSQSAHLVAHNPCWRLARGPHMDPDGRWCSRPLDSLLPQLQEALAGQSDQEAQDDVS